MITVVLGRRSDRAASAPEPAVVPSLQGVAVSTERFVASAEANDRVVEGSYAADLHRRREAGATAQLWMDLLDAGIGSATDVAVGILASDESLADALAGRS